MRRHDATDLLFQDSVSTDLLERKLERAGFADVAFGDAQPLGVDDVALYPLFPPDALALLRRALPPARQRRVAVAHHVWARLPERPAAAPPAAAGRLQPSGVRAITDVASQELEAAGLTVRHLGGVEDADLKVLDLAPGGATPHHTHLHAHEGVVVSGIGQLRLDDGAHLLRPGDVFRVNPRDRHRIVNTGELPLRVVCLDCLVR